MRDLQDRTTRILDQAESARKFLSAFVGIGQARSNVELLGKLLGGLEDAPATQINVLIAPQVQTAILEALRSYPEARLAVANALELLEASMDAERS